MRAPIPDQATASGVVAGDEWLTVPRELIRSTLADLKAQGYRSYVFMTCVDHLATPLLQRPPERFELVYQLRNMDTRHELRVRTYVPEADPRAPSAHDIFAPANWDERETWDMFGIEFEGHPNLTRILMPDDWAGHPLRRDFPVGGEPVDFSEDHETWQTAPPEA
ncbi:MAG TPA: NADH-quinone oxidoreductase subunit C [Candidatus Dormibacteraeota bacterium]|nr:NADH-quinone oxidoreductase subunit C [Candidatus Dormibacteraeota bacterium]